MKNNPFIDLFKLMHMMEEDPAITMQKRQEVNRFIRKHTIECERCGTKVTGKETYLVGCYSVKSQIDLSNYIIHCNFIPCRPKK